MADNNFANNLAEGNTSATVDNSFQNYLNSFDFPADNYFCWDPFVVGLQSFYYYADCLCYSYTANDYDTYYLAFVAWNGDPDRVFHNHCVFTSSD